ncbi:MAG: purine-binding chemotaxis protein CheW [Phycisphaerae bacterium]|nr:purine-binding chemotaxis protein CheW [Phycisphaerae bacterium]
MSPIITAQPRERATDRGAAIAQYVVFGLGDEEFAVDILAVQEISRPTALTRVPRAARGVEGVINLRGRVIPVVDARARLGMPSPVAAGDERSRIIVVGVGGRTLGFIVDRVHEVLRVGAAQLEPAPASESGAGVVSGVARPADRMIAVLDLDRLFGTMDAACPITRG